MEKMTTIDKLINAIKPEESSDELQQIRDILIRLKRWEEQDLRYLGMKNIGEVYFLLDLVKTEFTLDGIKKKATPRFKSTMFLDYIINGGGEIERYFKLYTEVGEEMEHVSIGLMKAHEKGTLVRHYEETKNLDTSNRPASTKSIPEGADIEGTYKDEFVRK